MEPPRSLVPGMHESGEGLRKVTASVVECVYPCGLESYMRRFLFGPIIASCIAWGAIPLPTSGQTNNALPPVRMVPGGEPVFETIDRVLGA